MTTELEAGLTVVPPDGPPQGKQITVHGPAEVEAFIAALAEPHVDNAYTTHSGRPARPEPELGDGDMTPVPDHVATLAVRGDFGYFYYIGSVGDGSQQFDGFAVGAPDSPSIWFDGATEMPPGSGIPLPKFKQAIEEFVSKPGAIVKNCGSRSFMLPWVRSGRRVVRRACH
jgi:hypothetical protein